MKASVVNSVGCSFCWNFATDTFYRNYESDNVSCKFRGSIAIMQVVLLVTVMLVNLSVTVMRVTVSDVIMQLKVSAALSR